MSPSRRLSRRVGEKREGGGEGLGVIGVKTFFGSHGSRRRAFGSPLHFLCAADVGQGGRRESARGESEEERERGREERGRVQQRAALSHSLGIWHMALTHSTACGRWGLSQCWASEAQPGGGEERRKGGGKGTCACLCVCVCVCVFGGVVFRPWHLHRCGDMEGGVSVCVTHVVLLTLSRPGWVYKCVQACLCVFLDLLKWRERLSGVEEGNYSCLVYLYWEEVCLNVVNDFLMTLSKMSWTQP